MIYSLRASLMRPVHLLSVIIFTALGCTPSVPDQNDQHVENNLKSTPIEEITEHIINLETEALTNWSKADLVGYTVNFADDASYIDNILAADGIYGLDSIRAYMAQLEAMELIGNHNFEIREPVVQVIGNTAILTLKHHAFSSDGAPAPVWKASVVYHNNENNDWQVVHANWSPYECESGE